MRNSSATISPVSGMESVPYLAFISGLTKRQPIVVSSNLIERENAASALPFVVGKADAAFSRSMRLEDTTIGWRFVNPLMKARYGTDSMPETGEIVAEEFRISREDQDAFALRSQQRAADAIRSCRMGEEIVAVPVVEKKGETSSPGKTTSFSVDEHPRPDTTLEALSKLKGIVKPGGTVTAGNASGVND